MKKTKIALMLSVFLVSSPSFADITFKGFASIVAGRTMDEVDAAVATERLSNIYRKGYEKDFSFTKDTKFALQATSDIGDGLSATAMILAEGEDDFDAKFNAAYFSYDINENWRINAGRIPWALFQYTDFLDVGYAYPWISPPAGVYDIASNNTMDGITGIYSAPIGNWDLELQLHSNIDNIYGAKATFYYEWLTINGIYVINNDNTIPAPPYEDAAASLAAGGFNTQAEDLLMNEDVGTFSSIGFNIDYNEWLVIGEYASVGFDPGWFSDFSGYYLTVGRRFGTWTTHITYDYQEEEPQLEFLNGLPAGTMIDFFGSTVPISVMERTVRGRAQDYSNIILGARYDFHPSAALKFEYIINDTDDGDDVTGVKEFEQKLFRVAIDLVF